MADSTTPHWLASL